MKQAKDKTREQLIKKVTSLRQRITEMDQSERELKRVEEALRESEEELEAIFNDARIGIAIFDMTGKILRVNKRMLEVGGYTEKEIVGKRFKLLKMFPKKSMVKMLTNFTKLISGKKVPSFDVEVHTKGGEKLTTELHGSLLRKKGRVAGMVGIMRDITERKRAEEALRESEEKYRTILETMEEGYYEVDLAGNFIFFNDSMCRIQGYPRDELMGMNNREYMDEETTKKVYKIFNTVFRTGKSAKIYDWQIIRKDGSKADFEASVSLIRDSSGNPAGFRGIVRDITEHRRTEELLKKERETF